jgi:hypothetical protein
MSSLHLLESRVACPACGAKEDQPCTEISNHFHEARIVSARARFNLLKPNANAPAIVPYQVALPILARFSSEPLRYGEAAHWTTNLVPAHAVFRPQDLTVSVPRKGAASVDRIFFRKKTGEILRCVDCEVVEAVDLSEFLKAERERLPTLAVDDTIEVVGNWTGLLPREWLPLRGMPCESLFVHVTGPSLAPPEAAP